MSENDDDLAAFREQTSHGDRIEEAAAEDAKRDLIEDILDALEAIDAGDPFRECTERGDSRKSSASGGTFGQGAGAVRASRPVSTSATRGGRRRRDDKGRTSSGRPERAAPPRRSFAPGQRGPTTTAFVPTPTIAPDRIADDGTRSGRAWHPYVSTVFRVRFVDLLGTPASSTGNEARVAPTIRCPGG